MVRAHQVSHSAFPGLIDGFVKETVLGLIVDVIVEVEPPAHELDKTEPLEFPHRLVA
jgi:homospermidine synthase